MNELGGVRVHQPRFHGPGIPKHCVGECVDCIIPPEEFYCELLCQLEELRELSYHLLV